MRRLPSLNALRAFEAAARHESFARAAAELFVTPAAISQQVRALEDELGIALFQRRPRRLNLTDAGRRLLPGVTDGFTRLAAAAANLDGEPLRGTLTVSMLPSFAHSWIVHRLGEFADRYPDIELIVQAEPHRADLRAGEADMAIRYGSLPSGQGLHAEHLIDELVFPVASPALLNGPVPLRAPADLLKHRLLSDSDERTNEPWLHWPAWFAHWGLKGEPSVARLAFNDTRLVNRAASAGQGVAIGRSVLVERLLELGDLVRLFDDIRPAGNAYYLIYPDANHDEPKTAAFREWIKEAMAKTANAEVFTTS